jgi:hypothetical protein
MDEKLLPEHIIKKAHITPTDEYSWKKEDFEEVIEAARSVGLASIGGSPQFKFSYGTYELYWINYDSQDRKPGEAWASYVDRSANEVLAAFRQLCSTTDFRAEAGDWKSIRADDPIDYLWFVIYFMREASIPMFDDWRKLMGDHLK